MPKRAKPIISVSSQDFLNKIHLHFPLPRPPHCILPSSSLLAPAKLFIVKANIIFSLYFIYFFIQHLYPAISMPSGVLCTLEILNHMWNLKKLSS